MEKVNELKIKDRVLIINDLNRFYNHKGVIVDTNPRKRIVVVQLENGHRFEFPNTHVVRVFSESENKRLKEAHKKTLIDLVLDIGDKDWFYELTKK